MLTGNAYSRSERLDNKRWGRKTTVGKLIPRTWTIYRGRSTNMVVNIVSQAWRCAACCAAAHRRFHGQARCKGLSEHLQAAECMAGSSRFHGASTTFVARPAQHARRGTGNATSNPATLQTIRRRCKQCGNAASNAATLQVMPQRCKQCGDAQCDAQRSRRAPADRRGRGISALSWDCRAPLRSMRLRATRLHLAQRRAAHPCPLLAHTPA